MLTSTRKKLDYGGLPKLCMIPKKKSISSFALLPHQTPPPGQWTRWLLIGGRGSGKTEGGAAWLLSFAKPGIRLFAIAPTFSDVRDTCFEGPSGLIAIARKLGLAVTNYNRSMAEATINGAIVKGYSGDQPDRLRGPQNHKMWIDELAAMPRAQEVFDMATMGCRLGENPQAVLTTTPRPTPIIKWLLADDLTVQTRASTFDNPHLPDTFKHQIMKKYQGTRLGRQELLGEILEDVEGALWTLGMIEALRVKEPPPMVRIVVAVDPPASSKSTGAEAGIVVCGIAANGHKYVLDDVSLRATPAEWGKQAVMAFDNHKADRLIIEVNQGGEMASQVLTSAAIELHRQGKRTSKHVPISTVYASRGKRARAEPIAALYEQGLIHHCGVFEALEEQMCTWVASSGQASPDRCFPAGTLISTSQGQKPIESIKIGEMVWTRDGLHRVSASGKTSMDSQLLRLILSCGILLECTPNHPIFVIGKGFIPAWKLQRRDRVLAIESRLLNSMGSVTEDTRMGNLSQRPDTSILTSTGTEHRGGSRFIGLFGNFIMGRLPLGFMSTTRTRVLKTTALRTLRRYRGVSMPCGTGWTGSRKSGSEWITQETQRPSGTGQKKAGLGILSTGRRPGRAALLMLKLSVFRAGRQHPRFMQTMPGSTERAPGHVGINSMTGPKDTMKTRSVLFVGNHSYAGPIKNKGIVPRHVAALHVVGRAPVYNLSVEGCPEYFANGILVHNCDALVWGLTALQGAVSDASGYNVSLSGSGGGISQKAAFSAYATPF